MAVKFWVAYPGEAPVEKTEAEAAAMVTARPGLLVQKNGQWEPVAAPLPTAPVTPVVVLPTAPGVPTGAVDPAWAANDVKYCPNYDSLSDADKIRLHQAVQAAEAAAARGEGVPEATIELIRELSTRG